MLHGAVGNFGDCKIGPPLPAARRKHWVMNSHARAYHRAAHVACNIGGLRSPVSAAAGENTMGLLVDGKWQDRWYDTSKSEGRFERSQSQFRNWVTRDGSAGPHGQGGFRRLRGAITCMCRSPAHGRTAR